MGSSTGTMWCLLLLLVVLVLVMGVDKTEVCGAEKISVCLSEWRWLVVAEDTVDRGYVKNTVDKGYVKNTVDKGYVKNNVDVKDYVKICYC